MSERLLPPPRVVAAAGSGEPTDPSTWSGTPAAICAALDRLGVQVSPVRTSLVRGERGLALMHGIPRIGGVWRAYGELTLRSVVHTGAIAAPLRHQRTRKVQARANRVDADAVLYFGASNLFVPKARGFVVLEDMTIRQVDRLAGHFRDWDAFPDGYRALRAEQQATQLRAASVAAFLTPWAADAAVAEYGLDPARIAVIGVGSRFPVEARRRDWSSPRFLFVGLDWERKRGDAVVEAFRTVQAQHPGAELHLVGNIPPLSAPGVVVHGKLDRADPRAAELLRELFRQATCFVLPSTLEPAGIVLAEACAHGVPSIVTTRGGGMDLVGDAGLGVDPDDPAALLAAMLEMAEPGRAEALGAVAARRAPMLTWDAVGERLAAAAGWWDGAPIPLTRETPPELKRVAVHTPPGRPATDAAPLDAGLLGGTRIFPVLRASHLEDLDAEVPRHTLFFRRAFDMKGMPLPPHAEQVSLRGLLRRLGSVPGPVTEIWEPLWVRELPRWLLVTRLLRRQTGGVPIAFYAIENNDLSTLLYGGGRRPPAFVDRALRLVLRTLISRAVDHVAFGSSGAAATYGDLIDPRRVQTATIEEVLAPTAETVARAGDGFVPADGHGAVFLGALEPRKGLEPLMRAWEEVERSVPGARLSIAGDGPLRERIEAWVAERPEGRRYVGLVARQEALELLAEARVLVAPSVPDGRWREQVGFPIQEGLARGLTIVTTEQTGLAALLHRSGHAVLDHRELDAELAGALAGALLEPVSPTAVVAALPARNGRVVADLWLHEQYAEGS